MRPLGLVVSTLLATTVCLTGPANAQPAPAPEPAPAPAPTAAPEAEPPAPAPEAPPAAESAPPAAESAPPAPPASHARGASRVSSPFGPPSQREPRSPVAARPESEPIEGRRIDEGTAAMLSIAGTLGSWTLFGLAVRENNDAGVWLGLAGLIVGPNLGHWYQGTIVTRGTGLRAIGTVSTLYGLIRLIVCEDSCDDTGAYFLYGGALLYLGATLDDIIDAPSRAKKHNQRFEVVGITPTITDRSAGFAIGGRF